MSFHFSPNLAVVGLDVVGVFAGDGFAPVFATGAFEDQTARRAARELQEPAPPNPRIGGDDAFHLADDLAEISIGYICN